MHEKNTNTPETQPSAQEMLQAGAEFIEHFSIKPNPIEEPEQFLEALKQLDPRHEGDKSLLRFELELVKDSQNWQEETQRIVMDTAEKMRMLETETPLLGHYDLVVALGATRMANLDRTLYAAEAARSGQADIDRIVVAGSARKVQDGERSATDTYAPGAITEYDLCSAAVTAVKEKYPELEITSYPAGDEKAGTPDVLANSFRYLRVRGSLPEGTRVGVVTTQIYQASTSIDARRVGKQFGLDIMAAGNPSDPKIVEGRTPATYKSEIIRTLKAAVLAAQVEPQPY